MSEQRQALLSRLGFRFGVSGPHAARTMMLDDLQALLRWVTASAVRADYASAIVEGNALGKPSRKSRELSLRHLSTLYSLDPESPIFRALCRLWPLNESAQPLLALAVSLARDPLLRCTRDAVIQLPIGTCVGREFFESVLRAQFPDRFSPASMKSLAQNIAGTWTSAGYLDGRVRKRRVQPEAEPESVAMLLLLGYLEGRSGQRLLTSDWTSLLGTSAEVTESLTMSASHRGLLVFMNAGGVKEVRFPGYLTSKEESIRQEVSHVV